MYFVYSDIDVLNNDQKRKYLNILEKINKQILDKTMKPYVYETIELLKNKSQNINIKYNFENYVTLYNDKRDEIVKIIDQYIKLIEIQRCCESTCDFVSQSKVLYVKTLDINNMTNKEYYSYCYYLAKDIKYHKKYINELEYELSRIRRELKSFINDLTMKYNEINISIQKLHDDELHDEMQLSDLIQKRNKITNNIRQIKQTIKFKN